MGGFVRGRFGIDRVFVLMLENRAFDHMLGYSDLSGSDAETGAKTSINSLKGNESNAYAGQMYQVTKSAADTMKNDPVHEFPDVVVQLCGRGAKYPAGGGPYPPINNSGFAESYGDKFGTPQGAGPDRVMACYNPAAQLPVLNALINQFVVCDNWFSSLPGPTWPNRMFAHAASSGGLDHSPKIGEIIGWELGAGFRFPNGTIFDSLQRAGLTRRVYAGDDFPIVSALRGVGPDDYGPYSYFKDDVQSASYNYNYTFIEPSYDVLGNYRNGTSQHPVGDVRKGEALVKSVYESIRNSPCWPNSLLIITWDEHGGFFDHVSPVGAVVPGDTNPRSEYNQFGFRFDQYGVRVPAVVISPRIPRNLIDHRLYDHSSIPATLEQIFQLAPLTRRDAAARSLHALASLQAPRDDAPKALPSPAPMEEEFSLQSVPPVTAADPDAPADSGNIPVVLLSAMRQDLQISGPQARQAILNRVQSIKTRGDAEQYLNDVRRKKYAARGQTDERS
jgi:phospholipase C